MKEKIIYARDTFFNKYWPDPVWSKVISVCIIAVVGSIFGGVYVWIKSHYDKVPFKTSFKQLINYFRDTTEINILIIFLSVLVIIVTLFALFKSFIRKIISKGRLPKVEVKDDSKELPSITEHSAVLFSYRLAKAFPGQRGLVWYQPKLAVERLKILLQNPLRFKSGGHGCVGDPVWWFRGGSALSIDNFKSLSKTKVLMGVNELEIKRIGVFISNSYYKSYIYVEVNGEKQTGLYNFNAEDIKRHKEIFGYSSEEFGLLGTKPISREQYDDGSTVIKNKVVDATSAELRVRFLSDYNFIIAAKQSPYNSKKFERETKAMLNGLLNLEVTPEIFFEYLDNFEKHEM